MEKGWNKKLFTCRSGSTSCASTYVYVYSNVLKLLFQRCLSFLVFMTCLMFDILFVHSEDHPQSQSKDDLKKSSRHCKTRGVYILNVDQLFAARQVCIWLHLRKVTSDWIYFCTVLCPKLHHIKYFVQIFCDVAFRQILIRQYCSNTFIFLKNA